MGSDSLWHGCQYSLSDFNPRSPCGERLTWQHWKEFMGEFQSTLPVWGATSWRQTYANQCAYFNPRSPCGERRKTNRYPSRYCHFNPRSPCGERLDIAENRGQHSLFQSTLPVWGATVSNLSKVFGYQISIHAPRVGSDPYVPWSSFEWRYFNPRSPCGERLKPLRVVAAAMKFQSTLPVWGATLFG